MGKDVMIACDFPNKETTLAFLRLFKKEKPFVKIGMELFYAEGPAIVREIKAMGHKVFLDLKLHDIPTTVQHACMVLRDLGADMMNLHAAGTIEMMKAAKSGLEGSENEPLLIAVTQLTSTSEERMQKELLISSSLKDTVKAYAQNAKAAGLGGVVCSPLEVPLVKEACGNDFITVTPGIRFADNAVNDQVRVTTPEKAKALGADYIVVGRAITAAKDPVAAYQRCIDEFVDAQ